MRPRLHLAALVLVGALLAAACVSDAATPNNRAGEPLFPATTIGGDDPEEGPSPDDPLITVLSSDPSMVTGGNARIRIENIDTEARVRLNGQPVNAAFDTTDDGAWEGVVTRMALGPNSLAVTANGLTFTESLFNHPARGPVYSGRQSEPMVCTTQEHGLGLPADDFCGAPTRVFWTYVDPEGNLQRLEGNPESVTPATVDLGDGPVDFFIRNEVGTINRGVYWLHSLDPSPTIGAIGQRWSGAPSWNGRLIMTYGSGCGAGYSQGQPSVGANPDPDLGGPVDIDLLREGYAVATSTLTTFATHCNDVISAETTMMVKERFIEGYGEPDATIGLGGSGGAMQALLVAQNHPGLLDGVVATLPFPDMVTVLPGVLDCQLLGAYYGTGAGQSLSSEQRSAINGHLTSGTCPLWGEVMGPTLSPAAGCAAGLAFDAFIPGFNPDGIRCTPWDAAPQVYGNPANTSGPPVAPFDNVGVQYGLGALADRVIGIGEFLDLNEAIGGVDGNGLEKPGRSVAPRQQIDRLYREGRVNQAGGDLRRIPLILIDVYTDRAGDIHDRWRAFTIRDRIGGGASTPPPNVALWTVDTPLTSQLTLTDYLDSGGGVGLDALTQEAVAAADEWITAVSGTDDESLALALADNRPESAADRCVLATGEVVAGPDVNEPGGACDLPVRGDPRTVAGADTESLVLKCALRPIDPTDYPTELSAVALGRLERIFPTGVCDYSRPGDGQARLADPIVEY